MPVLVVKYGYLREVSLERIHSRSLRYRVIRPGVGRTTQRDTHTQNVVGMDMPIFPLQ